MIDLKHLGLPEYNFIPFWCRFNVLFKKRHASAVSLCEWVTATDHSVNDELQPQISTGDHCSLADRSSRRRYCYYCRKLEKNCGNHPASNAKLKFLIWGVTYLGVTPQDRNDLRMLLIICKVTVKEETTKHAFLEIKHEISIKKS